jgi:anthranilate synthase component I
MQIIEELEPVRRGIYGGSVLYADFAGNLDSCIGIRTMLMQGKHAYLQAGAGSWRIPTRRANFRNR